MYIRVVSYLLSRPHETAVPSARMPRASTRLACGVPVNAVATPVTGGAWFKDMCTHTQTHILYICTHIYI